MSTSFRSLIFLLGAAFLFVADDAMAQRVVALSTLSPAAGFRIDGVAEGDLLGINSDAIGDFNGDGRDDFLVSAEEAQDGRGSTYVVFGRDGGFPAGVMLSQLNGANGFRLDGAPYDGFNHRARGAGDVNGDGRDDLIIGLSTSNGFDGRACIVYGQASMDAVTMVDTLGPGQITCMDGAQRYENVGKSVAALGDFNGDGLDDVAIGTVHGDFAGNESGSVYVIYGRAPTLGTHIALDTLDGTRGFRIDGATSDDRLGFSLGSGDFNGDGRADLIAGAEQAGPPGSAQGAAYVLFGTDQLQATPLSVAALDGPRGFALRSAVNFHFVGRSVASADLNHDGFDDMLIGTLQNLAFVVYGSATPFPADVDLTNLTGTNGFRILGEMAGDRCGETLAGVGDINGDGIDDIGLGAQFADPNGEASGKVYVLFGSTGMHAPSLQLGALPEAAGIAFHGAAPGEYCGLNISRAGDLNHDGGNDLLFSCHVASTFGTWRGAVHAIYGERPVAIFEDSLE